MITDAKTRKDIEQMLAALELIREEAATKPNGGAWAAGIAVLCLGTLSACRRDDADTGSVT